MSKLATLTIRYENGSHTSWKAEDESHNEGITKLSEEFNDFLSKENGTPFDTFRCTTPEGWMAVVRKTILTVEFALV